MADRFWMVSGLALLAACTLAKAQNVPDGSMATEMASAQKLPENPFLIGANEESQGNPLAGLAQLLALEQGYITSGQERLFCDALATRLAMLGDTDGALRAWARIPRPKAAGGPSLHSPLDGFTGMDAMDYLVKRAAGERVIMFGEEHVQPQTRSILKPILQRLWAQGYRYFAAETFSPDLTETSAKGHTLISTGTYTKEPVFANAVTEALRLGYTLVPYEIEPGQRTAKLGSLGRQNERERMQAENLKARIFDRDPNAKAIVWAGRAHVSEHAAELPGEGILKPMAACFREVAGINPLTVYLPGGAEQATPDHESLAFRWATFERPLERPSVFIDGDGNAYGIGGDVSVFFPRSTQVKGRAGWLMELGRKPVELPRELIDTRGVQLAQAFATDDVDQAVARDQFVIWPGAPLPVFMLESGQYRVRVIESTGAIHGPLVFQVN